MIMMRMITIRMNTLQITKESRKLNAALYALNTDEEIDEYDDDNDHDDGGNDDTACRLQYNLAKCAGCVALHAFNADQAKRSGRPLLPMHG